VLSSENLGAELAKEQVPPELISRLGIGRYWGCASMFTLGFIVLAVLL
jgi:hypothetical protein